MANTVGESLEQSFRYFRDMDGSLKERLDAFSNAVRERRPAFQDVADRLVSRLAQNGAGQSAPKPGELMPPFLLPNENGRLVSSEDLLTKGPLAITFHPGHWCPYCRINLKALVDVRTK